MIAIGIVKPRIVGVRLSCSLMIMRTLIGLITYLSLTPLTARRRFCPNIRELEVADVRVVRALGFGLGRLASILPLWWKDRVGWRNWADLFKGDIDITSG